MIGEDLCCDIKSGELSKSILKRLFVIFTILISILLFLYITLNAYYFVTKENSSNIKIVKAPDFKIKTVKKNDKFKIKNIDKLVYNNIIGKKEENFNKKKAKIIKTEKIKKKISKVNSKMLKYDIIDNNVILREESSDKIDFKPMKGMSRVQIAALSSQESAVKYWKKIKKSKARMLKGLKYYIEKVDLGKRGSLYRLQIGNFKNQIKAENFCERFIIEMNNKANCILIE